MRVTLAGETLAESTRPLVLFETDEPTRFYLAQADVRLDLLEPSETVTTVAVPGHAPSGSRPASRESSTPTSPGPTASRSPSMPRLAGLLAFRDDLVREL